MSVSPLLLLIAGCGLALAGNWSGVLVDAGCYESTERNVNPQDTLTSVDRDTNEMIRYCAPGRKTKFFLLVEPAGDTHRLDVAGDAKASDLLKTAGSSRPVRVTIQAEQNGRTLKVDSIVASK